MAGYTRQAAANIVANNIIDANDFNDEFNAIETAFNASTGHTHDGTAAGGGRILEIGPNGEFNVSSTQLVPLTSNTIDIGSLGAQYKDLYIDGNAYIDGFAEDTTFLLANKIQFRDNALYIHSSVDGQLDIAADAELQIVTPLVDLDGILDVSGSITAGTTIEIGASSVDQTELGILDGATVTTAELNILDGVTATASEINILDGANITTTELNILGGSNTASGVTINTVDRLILNDSNVMKQVAMSDFEDYFETYLVSMPNLTTVGALNAGSITSGFGNIDIGSSTITTTGAVSLGNTSVVTLDASGATTLSGTATLSGATTLGSTLDVTGNTTLSSNLTVEGNTTIGNASTDTVIFNAEVASSIVPSLTHTHSLGTINDRWNYGYFRFVNALESVSVGGDLTVTGDLTINGTTTTVNTTNTVVSDSLIELGNGTTGAPVNDAGIIIERGTLTTNAFMGWDESEDKFRVGYTSSTGASTGNLNITTGTLLANIEGTLVGAVNAATLQINGTTVTATAADLNYAQDLRATGVTSTEYDYLDGVTSNIQTQLNSLSSSIGSVNTELVNDTTPQLGGQLDTNGESIKFGNWTIVLDGTDLEFRYSNVAKFKIASDGEVTAAGDITAVGSP
jgi:hypothetical protein